MLITCRECNFSAENKEKHPKPDIMKRFSLSFAAVVTTLLSIAPLANAQVTFSPTVTPSTTVCANDEVTLSLTPSDGGTYSYKWQWTNGTGGTEKHTTQSISDYPTTTTDYEWWARDEYDDLAGHGTVSVNVNSAPTVTADPSTYYVISGGDVTLKVSGNALAKSYEWTAADGTVQTSTTDELNLTGVTEDTQYTVVAIGANGCRSKSVTVKVVTFSVEANNETVCYGDAVTLTAESADGSKYYWDDGFVGESNTVYPKGVPTTTYTVTIKDANDALVATQSIKVNVIAKPEVTLTPDETNICAGKTVTITATNNTGHKGKYVWNTGDTGNSLIDDPSVTTTYWVQFTDGTTGCTSGKTYCTINVSQAGSASINGANSTCVNTPIELTVSGGTAQRWFDESGIDITMPYTPTSVGTKTIYCIVKDANGCEVKAQKTITVAPALTPTIYGDFDICVGESAQLKVSTDGATYLWSNNSTEQSITVSPTSDASYWVDVTKNGCTARVTQKVTVNAKPTINITGGTTICKGSTAVVTAVATGGSGTYTYAWDDENSTTNATLRVAPTSTKTYKVTATDAATGCSSEKSVTIAVESGTPPTILGPTTVCKGVDFTLTASDGDSFAWDDDASTTTASMTANLTTDRTYTLTVKKGSCTYTVQHKVTIEDGPVGEITGETSICKGGSTKLTAPAGTSYTWSTGSTEQSITVTTAGTYWVEVKKGNCTLHKDITITVNTPTAASITTPDGLTLCANNELGLKLVASEGKAYKWSPTGETSQEITAKPTATGLYSVTVTDEHGCESTASVLVTVVEDPAELALNASATTVCKGENVILTVLNAPSGSTISSNDGSVTGNVVTHTASISKTVTVKVKSGTCEYVLTKDITVLDAPAGTITGTTAICQGGSTVLAAPVAPAGQVYTYLWNTGETSSTITVSAVGDYYVTVSNGSCETKLAAVTVTENIPTAPTITASKSTICAGETITLTASNYGSITGWNDGTQNLGNAQVISVSPTTTTNYELVVTDANGCEAKAYQQIVVSAPIDVTLTGDNSVCEGGTISVTVSGAPSGSTYSWSTAGTLSNGDATLTFTPGVNDAAVSVTVTPPAAKGCAVTKTFSFTVTPAPTGNITGVTSVCNGGSTTLYAPAGPTGTAYKWNTGATTQSITTPALFKNTVYSVDIVYPTGCTLSPTPVTVKINAAPIGTITASSDVVCVGEQVELTVTSATATGWTWSNGTTGTNKAYYTPTTSGNVQYYVDITANGCTERVSKNITVVDKPVAAIDKSASTSSFCEGEQVTIVATGGTRYELNGQSSTTGVFLLNPTATTTYTISVFNENDCESLVTHTVTKLTPTTEPSIVANGSLELCVGDSRTLSINNGTIISWADGTSTPNYIYTATSADLGTKTITAEVKDMNGCTKSLSIDFVVTEIPSVAITTTNGTICKGEKVTLTATPGLASYSWESGEKTQEIIVSPSITTTYVVTGTNAGGCSSTAKITINVATPDAVSISGPATACPGESVTLSAVGGKAWNWSHGLGTGNTATFNAATTTTYTCEITDSKGCVTKVSHTLTVKETPTPTVSGNLKVCQGLNTTLSASTADAYEWKKGATVLSTASTLTLTNVQSSEDYTLTVTVNGCQASTSFRVTACENPTDAAIVGKNQVCEGESVTLTAVGNGTYSWSTGATGSEITVTPTAANHIYQLTVTDMNGCTQTVQKNITVSPTPSVTIDGPTEVCAGGSVTLTASGSGTFLWDDGTTTTATLNVTPSVTRAYKVTLTDASGCTVTASHTVNVKTLTAPKISAAKTDVCKGDKVTLTATGETGCTFTWPDLGRTGASVEVYPSTTTTYKVTATNTTGCTADGYITINVHEQPTVTVLVDKSAICAGESATITVTGGTEYTCNGETNTSGIFNVSPTTTTPYNIVVKNSAGCTTTTSQTITVNELPTISISGVDKACAGELITLTATGGTEYSWSNGMTSQTATYTVSGTGTMSVWVKGKNASGCWSGQVAHNITINTKPTIAVSGTMDICVGKSTTLTASGASTYVWTWNGGSAMGNTLSVSPNATTVYKVVGTDANGCVGETSVTVNVYPEPTVSITGATEVCEGGEITLTANGTGTFLWDTGESSQSIKVTSAGTYSVTLTGEGGCTSKAEIIVKQRTITAKINDVIDGVSTICEGSDITLTASGGNAYKWDNGLGTNATVTVSPTTSTTYWVEVTDASGCSKRVSHTVKVTPQPTLIVVGNTTICYGETASITVSGAKTYVWSDGIGTGASINVTPASTSTYTVTATDENGCVTTQDIKIEVVPTPVASIKASKTTVCEGESVTLTAEGGDNYVWGDGSTGASITVTPTAPSTTYSVTAYKNGCASAEVSQIITVNALPTVTIKPSATTVCKGEQVTLTASGATSYEWSTGEKTQAITVTVNSDATYSVIGTQNGCQGTASQSIKVAIPPTINISSNTGKLYICNGESITLTASGANTYTWSGGLGNTASITVTPTATTVYEVEGVSANGCKAKVTVEVIVYDKPNPTISGQTEICEGSYTTLTANDANAVAWEWNTGAKTKSINAYQAGTYTVTVTGKGGCTSTATVIVTYLTPVNGSISGPETVCKGETVTLTASGGKTYKWDENAAESEKLVLSNIQVSGTHWVTITGANGCTQRLGHSIIVNEPPTLSITGNQTFCEGGSTTLTAVGTGDVLWSTGSTNRSITVSAEGKYDATLTDANGCSTTQSVNVTRNPLPVAIISGPTKACEGEPVTLTVSGAESYTWSTGATGSSITVQPTTTTTYTVTPKTGLCTGDPAKFTVTVNKKPVITFSGDLEICAGTKAVITADGADEYVWGDGSTGATYTTAVLESNTTFTVTGTITETGCSAQKQITVVVNPKPEISISGTTSVCAGESTKLTASPSGATYAWSNGSTGRTATFSNLISDEDYWVDVTLDNGCTDRYYGTIKVYDMPAAEIITNTGTNTVCRGESITLTASGGTTYLWTHDGTRSASVTVTPTTDTKYTVKVIGEGNCSSTASINVQVLDVPEAAIVADKTTVCEGDDVTLSANDGVKWQWYKGNTAIAGETGQHYTISNASYGTTTYKVVVENAAGCSTTASYALAVTRKPDATISGVTNICSGTSTTLTAPLSDSYLWSTGETTRSINVTPAAGKTDYTVTVTAGDCSATGTVTVTVNPLPTPTLQADENPVCVGNSTTLTAGAGFKYYKWSTGQEGPNLQSIGVSPTENTIYTVTVTDANGCTGVAQVTVNVTQVPAPTITVLSGSETVCAGEEVILQSSAAKGYQWSSNVEVSQQNGQTVVVYPTQTSVYTVTTTNKSGCQSSKDITINVTKLPTPKITGADNMCKGDETGVELTASSDVAGATFVWSTGDNTANIVVKPTKTTTYKVWAYNGTCKNSTPAEFTLKVNDAPAAAITGRSAICLGETVELEATGGVTYLWQNIEGSAKALSKITVSPTQTTKYICTVTDDHGCTKDVSLEVVVNPLPKPSITGKNKICRGGSVTLAATGGNSYLWSTNETTKEITVTPAYTTTYTVEATNANGCTSEATFTVEVVQEPKVHIEGPSVSCSGTPVTLTVTPEDSRTYTCIWKHNNSTKLAEAVNPTTTTTYEVEVFDGECSKTLTHTVTVNKLEDPKIDGPAQICLGEATTLTVSNNPNNFVSYQWSTGETTQSIEVKPAVVGMSTYTVICTDANECTSEATIDIVVNALPDVTVTASTDVLCEGDNSVTLTASGAGISGKYNWYEDELATVLLAGGEGTATYTFNDLTYTKKIYVVAISKLGCKSAPKEYELVVTPKPSPTITSSVPANVICAGGTVELSVSDPDPDVTFVWSDGTEGAHMTATAAGEYRVTATNVAGCTQDATITLNEEPLPAAKITPSIIAGTGAGVAEENIARICAGTRLKLTASPLSTQQLTYTYKWNTGSIASEITVNPTASTTYSVVITSASGCEQTATIEVKVNEFVTIEGKTEVCAGMPYVLNAIGNNLSYYEWTRNGEKLPQFDGVSSIKCVDSVPDGQMSAEVVYGVKCIYDNNCETDTTITVKVYAKPSDLTINGIGGADAMDSVCVESAKQLSVIPTGGSSLTGATYNWTGSGITDPTAATQTITPTAVGQEPYSCQITMPGGCDTTVNIILKAVALPELAVCPDTTICFGTEAQLYLTAKNNCPDGTTITWTSDNGGGGASGDVVRVAPTTTTTYTVTAKTPAPLGCSTTQTVTVTVIPQQQPTVTPSPALICLDAAGISEDDLNLTTEDTDSEGRAFKAYKWYAEDDPTTIIGTSNAITVPKANITATRTYVVEVTTQEGCTALGSVEVPVSEKPSVSIKGETQVCEGKSLVLQAESPINVTRYEWTTNDDPNTVFATTQSVTVWPTTTVNTYYLTVYNDKGCRFEVNPGHNVTILKAPKPQIAADHNPICEGDDVILTASDLNSGTCTVVWDDNSTNPVRKIVGLTSTTTYNVTLTNENGCVEQVEYTVNVNPLPKLKITGNTQVCVGDSVLLSVEDANGVDNKYSWTGGAWREATDQGSVNNSKVWVYPTNVVDSTEYCVTSVDVNSCNSKQVCHKILAFAKPIAMINGKQMATDTICVGQSLILEATGGSKFKWSTNAESQQITTPIYNSVNTYIFWVDVYNEANCVQRDSIWIKVAPKPSAYIESVSPATQVCEGTTVTMRASDAPTGSRYTYAWTNNTGETIENANQQEISVTPTVTTAYKLVITDVETECVKEILQTIYIDPKAKVNFTATPDTICEGDVFSLEIEGDVSNQTIAWEKLRNGSAQDASSWADKTTILDSPTASEYIYRATLTNKVTGCLTVLERRLVVVRVPKASIQIPNKTTTTICQGDPIELQAWNDEGKYSLAQMIQFVWKVGDDTIAPLNQQKITVYPRTTTTYTLIMQSLENGCTSSYDTTINVLEIPKVNVVELDNQVICEDEEITFTLEGLLPEYGVTWNKYDRGNLIASWTKNGVTTVTDKPTKSEYEYRVNVSNPLGCDTTIVRHLRVNAVPRPGIKFPGTKQDTICEGEEAWLQATNAESSWSTMYYTYGWLNHGDTLTHDDYTLKLKPTKTDNYTFYIIDKTSGCRRTIDTTIVVLPIPRVELSEPGTSLCEGEMYTLELSSELPLTDATITWTKTDSYSTTLDTKNDIVTYSDMPTAGNYTYTVVIANKNKCDTTIVRKLSVSTVPQPYIMIGDGTGDTICEGDQVKLIGQNLKSNYNFTDYPVAWIVGNDTLQKDQTQLIDKPQKTTTYKFVVTNAATGCFLAVDTTIYVKARPATKLKVKLPGGSTDSAICKGESISMQIVDTVANNTDGLHVQWKRNGVIVNEWKDKFDIVNYTPDDDESYVITVDNGRCPIVLNYDLTVNYLPDPTVELRAGSREVCAGTRVDIGGAQNQDLDSRYVYEWTTVPVGEVIANPHDKDIAVYPYTTTTYVYTVTDTQTGCSRSDSIAIAVNQRPNVTLEVIYPEGADGNLICQTEPVTLRLRGETDSLTTLWFVNTIPQAEWADKLSITDAPSNERNDYTVKVSNGKCELQIDTTILVSKVPNPKIYSVGDITTICEGTKVELKAQEAQISTMVNGKNINDYRWTSSNPKEVLENPTNQNILVYPKTTTTYTYTATNLLTGCSRFDTLRIVVNLKPEAKFEVAYGANIAADSTICAGDPVTLRVTSNDAGNLYTKWYANEHEVPDWENLLTVTDVCPDSTVIYRVEVSNDHCTADPLEQTVKVKFVPNPTIEIKSGGTTMCEGEQLLLVAKAAQRQDLGFKYQWLSSSPNDQISDSTGQSLRVYPTGITTYTYVVTDPATGCSRTGQIQINVNKKPDVRLVTGSNTLAKDTLVCGGNPITLRVDGDLKNLTFAWYKNSLVQPETSSSYTDTPESNANYYVIVTDTTTGCETTMSDLAVAVEVNIMPVPTIELVGAGVTNHVCKGTTITLQAKEDQPHDVNTYRYQWSGGGKSSLGSTQSINVKPDVTTTYMYTVRNLFTGCTRSVDTTIYVYDVPKVTLSSSIEQGYEDSYCAGDPVTLSVTAGEGTNADDLQYTWLRNNEVIAGATTNTLIDYPMGTADNVNDTIYTYEVVVQNKASHCQADPAGLKYVLTVKPLPVPTITAFDNNGDVIEKNQTVCPDRDIRLQGTHLSGKLFRYTWYSQNQTDPDITTTDKPNEVWVSPSQTTTYTLEIENLETGCKRTTTHTISVLATPKIKITSTAKQDDGKSVACVNDPDITLKVVQADGSEIDDFKFNITWLDDLGNDLGGTADITLTADEVSTHTYTVQVENVPGTTGLKCPVVATHVVDIQTAPTDITIDAYTNDGRTLLTEKEYVCAGEPVLLEAKKQDKMTYEWRDEWGTVYTGDNNSRTFTVNPQKTTTYTVKVTNMGGCSYEVSRKILVNPKPTVTISGPTSFCLEEVGKSFTLKATSNPYSKNYTTIVWTYEVDGGTNTFEGQSIEYAPQKAGTYKFTVVARHESNSTICESDPVTYQVIVAGVPQVTTKDLKVISSLDSTANACVNTRFEIEATPGYTKYVFGTTDRVVYTPKQESDKNTFNDVVKSEGSWIYYCDFYNAAGCYSRQEIDIEVNPMPDNVTITPTAVNGSLNDYKSEGDQPEAVVCEGTSLRLKANASGNTNAYSWSDSDGKTHPSQQEISVTPSHTTTYTVSVTNLSGCLVTSRFTVKVVPMDKLTLTANNTNDSLAICAGSKDKVTLRVTGSSASTFDYRCPTTGAYYLAKPASIQITAPQSDEVWYVYASSSANSSYGTSCLSEASVKIHVLNNPDNTKGSIKVNGGESFTVCAGSTVTLTGDHADAVTYLWSTGEVKPSIQVLMPNYEQDTTITFWAIGRNALGCDNTQDTMKLQLRVRMQPEPKIVSETICYEQQPLRLEAGDKTLTYRWYDENGNEVSRKYYCEIKHDTAGIYNYKLTARNDANCENTITVSVTVRPFEANISGLTYLCSGNSTKLWVDGCSLAAGYQFRWTFAGEIFSTVDTVTVSRLGTYGVEVTTPWLTSAVGTIEVQQSETPNVKFTTPQPACQGDRYAMLPYNVTSGMPTQYTIIPVGNALTVGFDSVSEAALGSEYIFVTLPNQVTPGNYEVVIRLTNANGCGSADYRVKFYVGQDLIEEAWTDVLMCKDLNHEFTSYQWYRNGDRITGANLQYYSETGGFNGDYYVVAYRNDSSEVTSCSKSVTTKQNVGISPNPVQRYSKLQVEVPFTIDELFGARLEVVDAIGRTIYVLDKVDAENSLFVSYPAGVYMVRVSLTNGEVFTEKFVVQ